MSFCKLCVSKPDLRQARGGEQAVCNLQSSPSAICKQNLTAFMSKTVVNEE